MLNIAGTMHGGCAAFIVDLYVASPTASIITSPTAGVSSYAKCRALTWMFCRRKIGRAHV